ncbi:hypothetical protein [Streptomyces sp. WM6378]|uniref:hypothetical protein n=1 Tax=Streptomyces sp. WM6378 TaxID=1415557 RepID=UPI0006AE64D4|nr:hypothetical protein [Streptomyces sp. WM6378]
MSEQAPIVVGFEGEQIGYTGAIGVVEVGHTGHRVGFRIQNSGEVLQVLAVAPHLGDRMQEGPVVVADPWQTQVLGVGQSPGVGPLLELDDDVGRPGRAGVPAGQHHVGPQAGQRQPVLDQYLDMLQSGFIQHAGQGGQAVAPGPYLPVLQLAQSRPPVTLGQIIGHRALLAAVDELVHRHAQ